MITMDALIVTVAGLERADVERWIDQDWVRPTGRGGAWLFGEIDVARLRLIQDLRHDLNLPDDAMPLVLRLLDQLYDERRRLRRLRRALDRTVPPALRDALIDALRAEPED